MDFSDVTLNAVPGTEICDFCSGVPRYSYPAKSFVVPASELPITGLPDYGSDAGWLACEECHRLIEAEDHAGLLDRTIHVFLARYPVAPGIALKSIEAYLRATIGRLQRGFFAHRTAPAQPWRKAATN